jgi:hypothetical protein
VKNWFQGFAFKSSENPVSNFAFKSNLNRYTKVSQLRMAAVDALAAAAAARGKQDADDALRAACVVGRVRVDSP